ncbi:probable 4-coumarate--CoA ligase 1 [Sycon ciliatum]|uniref:probable 4-coumarate--CoA ligase 1 n=1 Tax=Sycon ciliatum TaxID=27933 RepID=UPI0031F6A977
MSFSVPVCARRLSSQLSRSTAFVRTVATTAVVASSPCQPPVQPPSANAQSPTSKYDLTIRSVYPTVDIPSGNMPIHKFIFDNLTDEDAKRTAIVDAITGQTFTYGQLYERIRKFGSSLVVDVGLRRNDVVAVYMPNIPDYATAFLGAMAAGGVVTSVNSLYTPPEIARQLADASVKVLVTCAPFLENATQAAKQHGLQSVIAVGVTTEQELNGVRVVPFSQHLDNNGNSLPDYTYAIQKDIAVLPYSSGTTGVPKGVQLTHRNIISNLMQVSASPEILCYRRCENESILCVLPFFHIYGMVVLLLTGLYQRTRLVTMPKFEPERYLATIQKEKITQLFVAPPLALFLAKHPMVSEYDLSSAYSLLSGAAPLSAQLSAAVSERLNGCRVFQGYGMSELSPVCHVTPYSTGRHGSAGIAVPNTEVTIISTKDPNNTYMLGKGVSGEICIRGPQVMAGYLNRPEATAATIDRDGWLHTGDIGYHDSDGYLFVTDRLKELIKRKGYQVAPAELERELLSHPLIDDAAVIGVPDDREGELPRAFIVRKSGTEMSEKDVMSFMEKQVAPFKQLDGGIVFMDVIPKSAAGKILRRELRDK